VETTPEEQRIPVFVLSCRVFGYSVENALMNHVKRGLRTGARRIVAPFAVTQHNQPCHRFYPDGGFALVEGRYVWEGDGASADASWLTVTTDADA
jgi:predicted enzyme involved in methoxymalonyl-ACP biosynthesis